MMEHLKVTAIVVLFSLTGCGGGEQADSVHHASVSTGPESATVSFANSCSEAVQSAFSDGVTLLHSFEYPESMRIFTAVAAQDPACAMARWGMAMSLWHPLWAAPDAIDLQKGAEIIAAAAQLATTEREQAYIDALALFYASTDPESHLSRVRRYEQAMARLYESHREDPEAAMFYALALLASADPRDKSYQNQFKAAALLNWVRESQPLHPGVLHYLIHSYDYPELAHLALGSAMIYAGAAPNSAHAQHMPSHIFTRLGLWELSLASNHDSTRSAVEYTQRARLPGHYDEGLHSMDYLMYALLQTARDVEAGELLQQLAAIDRTDTENFKVAYTYAAAPARYALERRQWQEAAQLRLMREDFAWADFGWAESIHHFARGIGAARSGDLDAARQELRLIRQIESELPAATHLYFSEEVGVHAELVNSWILFLQGEVETALAQASHAADREDAVDKHPVTPGEVIPARELYADMLLENKQPAAALVQYRQVLSASPNRLNALIGAAAALNSLGEREEVVSVYASIRTQTGAGERQRSGLQSAWQDGS